MQYNGVRLDHIERTEEIIFEHAYFYDFLVICENNK